MADKGLFDHSDRVYLQAQVQSERQRQEALQKQEEEQLALFRMQALKPPAAPTLAIPAKTSKIVADKPLNKIVVKKRVQTVVKKQPAKRPKVAGPEEQEAEDGADEGSGGSGLPIASYPSDSDNEATETKSGHR